MWLRSRNSAWREDDGVGVCFDHLLDVLKHIGDLLTKWIYDLAIVLKVGVQQTILTQSTAAHFSLVRTVVSGSLSLVAKARLKLFLYITTVCKHWVPTWQ